MEQGFQLLFLLILRHIKVFIHFLGLLIYFFELIYVGRITQVEIKTCMYVSLLKIAVIDV